MNVWTVTPSGTYLVDIRAALDLEAGTPLDYDGTLDEAYTVVAATLAYAVDQGVARAVDNLFLSTAEEPVLVRTAIDAGLTLKPATFSRYTVRVQCTGTVEIPLGTRCRGGGPLGRSSWAVVDATANYTNGAAIVIEAEDSGPIALADEDVLSLITPVTGVTGFVFDDADPWQNGVAAETPAQLRYRILERQAARTSSATAIRSALREIPWVIAADVRRPAPGQLAITIAPAAVGSDQEAELGAAIYASIGAQAETTGSTGLAITDANGEASTVYYTAGSTESVALAGVLTLDGSVSSVDAIAAATAALQEMAAAFGAGDSVYRLRSLAAMSVPGVTGATLTLNGSAVAASVAPSTAANVLVLSISLTTTGP